MSDTNNVLLEGDCLEVLKELPDSSVDAIVTDPPYGLKFMGKKWDYEVPSIEIWREVLRVLKPGGHLLSFGGTRTYHRMVVNIEDAGFEIRDQLQWLYGSGFPKSHNLDGEHEGKGTALKPANEPIVLARKPLDKGLTIAQNVLKYGTGALNIDTSRIGYLPAKGRWPANILFDEEAAKVLDAQSGVLKSGDHKSSYIQKASANNCMTGSNYERAQKDRPGDSGGASRFFYVAKASKRERNAGLEGMPTREMHRYGSSIGEGADPHSPSNDKNHHPTVKPIKLMEYLIKLITPPNGIVLDPFMGSGSTGVAAKTLGFDFIGVERDHDYMKIAEGRLNGTAA